MLSAKVNESDSAHPSTSLVALPPSSRQSARGSASSVSWGRYQVHPPGLLTLFSSIFVQSSVGLKITPRHVLSTGRAILGMPMCRQGPHYSGCLQLSTQLTFVPFPRTQNHRPEYHQFSPSSMTPCLSHQHAVERCPAYGRAGHGIPRKTTFLAGVCSEHSTQIGCASSREHPESARLATVTRRKMCQQEPLGKLIIAPSLAGATNAAIPVKEPHRFRRSKPKVNN